MTPNIKQPYFPLLLLCFLCLFVVHLFVASASAQSVDQTDNQLWTDVQLAVRVTSQFDFNILGTLRVGRDISDLNDERIGAGFTFKPNNYLTLSPSYIHIGMQPFGGRRLWENRLSFPVQVQFNVGDFKLTERNLIERRLRNSGVKSTRYRNRVQVEHPVGPKNWQLSLIVSDEVFYDWTVDRWVRNRFTVGGSKKFHEHFTQEVYYLRQNDGVSVPGDLNVIGTILRFRL